MRPHRVILCVGWHCPSSRFVLTLPAFAPAEAAYRRTERVQRVWMASRQSPMVVESMQGNRGHSVWPCQHARVFLDCSTVAGAGCGLVVGTHLPVVIRI